MAPVSEVDFEQAVGQPLTEYAYNCHLASLKLVRSGALGVRCRVARGWTPGILGQHSWIVLGWDCYDPEATVVDATLWSYLKTEPQVWIGSASERPHQPLGTWESIWKWGRPNEPIERIVALNRKGLSDDALRFLDWLGPLDHRGWIQLANAPLGDWPAGEIFAAMTRTPGLRGAVPIDILGMITDLNPGELYW